MRRTPHFAASLALLILALMGTAPLRGQSSSLDALLPWYEAGDAQVIARTLTTYEKFEALRKELGVEKDGVRTRANERWARDWRPLYPLFMLEVALVAHERNWEHWLDVLEEARRFVASRPQAPGTDARQDEFEIAWHKASVSLLAGLRRPDLLEKHGIGPLKERMAPAPAPGMLSDPWITLARGMGEEQWAAVRQPDAAARSAAALRFYEDASQAPATRDEALVRRAALLLAGGRTADALSALDGVDAGTADRTLAYWMWLFRGRALAALGRADDAALAYRGAQTLIPTSQAARMGLLSLAVRGAEQPRAFALAQAVLRTPHDVRDPWWDYATGDFRLLRARVSALRRLVFE